MPAVTLKKVAKKAHVSLTTASLILSGKGKKYGISIRTIDGVLKAARDLGYAPNALALAMSGHKTHTLGLIHPQLDIMDEYITRTLIELGSAVRKSHYLLVSFKDFANLPEDRLDQYVEIMLQRLVDGLIITANVSGYNVSLLDEMQTDHFPFVLMPNSLDPAMDRFNTVAIDLAAGTRDAAEHAIAAGYKRFVFICSMPEGGNRVKADILEEVLSKAGKSLQTAACGQWPIPVDNPLAPVEPLLKKARAGDIFFFATDYEARAALGLLQRYGKKIPQDIGVIGFNNDAVARAIFPKLSTVDQPLRTAAEKCSDLLTSLLDNPKQPPKTIMLPSRFIPGETTRKP